MPQESWKPGCPLFLSRTELKEDRPAGVTALSLYLGLGWPLSWSTEVQDSLKSEAINPAVKHTGEPASEKFALAAKFYH